MKINGEKIGIYVTRVAGEKGPETPLSRYFNETSRALLGREIEIGADRYTDIENDDDTLLLLLELKMAWQQTAAHIPEDRDQREKAFFDHVRRQIGLPVHDI
jgi:hypothetical protein